MHQINVTSDLIHRSDLMAAKIPSNISKSILRGGGRSAGCLGEIGVIEFFKTLKYAEIIKCNENSVSYSDDLTVHMWKKDFKFVVKTTRRTVFVEATDRKGVPYYAHIEANQLAKQEASDYLIFTSIKYDSKIRDYGESDGYRYFDPEWIEIIGMYKASEIRDNWLFKKTGEKGKDYKPAVQSEFYLPYTDLKKLGTMPIP